MAIRLAGSSNFKVKTFSGTLQIAAGASGDILTLTPAAGKKVKLTGLAALTAESGISIYIGSQKVVNNKLLMTAGTTPTVGGFIIGVGMASGTTGGGGTQILDVVQGEANEAIRVVKETGSTASAINYSFADGE